MPVIINGTTGITTPTYNGNTTAEYLVPVTGFKNRIINGAMTIDQRNAGASVSAVDSYPVDRWQYEASQASKFTLQQNQGSVTPPAGFTNYVGATSSSSYSVSATDFFFIGQRIEGFNVADLNWGTANAKTVTLSFWVRSSLTGTFGGSLVNSAGNRSYPYSYTISAANTWEQKSVTIAGDTSGTWVANNGLGIRLNFNLGTGSTYSGTAGAWAGTYYSAPTGATSVVGTNGATFYITGVQLEVGSTATSFDYRPYGTELALCQRYCPVWTFPSSSLVSLSFTYSTTTSGPAYLANPVPVRTPATGVTISSASNFSVSNGDFGTTCNSISFQGASTNITVLTWNTASARTAFQPLNLFTNTTNAFIIGNGCEL